MSSIDREDTIEILKDLQKDHLQFCLIPFRQAIERVQALPSTDIDLSGYSDKLWKNAYERGKADRPQGEWIPCSKQLPEEGQTVLIQMRLASHRHPWEEQRCIEFGRISSDREDAKGIGWEWLNESGADYWEPDYGNLIVAWMPLPEPWKGADDGTR